MARPKKAKEEKKTEAAAAVAVEPRNSGELRDIALRDLTPSPFDAQARRRKRFTDESITELAKSIKATSGLIQAIVVRPKGKKFEIVAGERRYLALQRAGFQTAAVIVRDISDDAVKEMQLIENLQRQDADPVDEAYDFADLMKLHGWNEAEVAERVGRSEKYVRTRLKLRDVGDVVQKDLQKGTIMLSHALEIAKYPKDVHEDLLEMCYDHHTNEDGRMITIRELQERIETSYLHRLNKAPFPVEATNLRADYLSCRSCDQRSGANAVLFDDFTDPDEDRCLNPHCWEEKTAAFVQLRRVAAIDPKFDAAAATPTKQQISKAKKNVKLVEAGGGSIEYGERQELRRSEPNSFVEYWDYERSTKLKSLADCTSAEVGVLMNGKSAGKTVYFCQSRNCKTHNKQSSSSSTSTGKSSAKENAEFHRRKEEIFEAKVQAKSRLTVLTQASLQFTAAHRLFGNGDAPHNDKYRDAMLFRFWSFLTGSYWREADEIMGIVGRDKAEHKYMDRKEWLEAIGVDQQEQVRFLMLFSDTERIDENYPKPQSEIKALAEQFGINYALIDAQTRFDLAPKKHKDVFREYLRKIESGMKNAHVPRVYYPKYTPPAK
jgi:ParB/RepB/Spo0J family partition protein